MRQSYSIAFVFLFLIASTVGCTSNKTVHKDIIPRYAIADPEFEQTMGSLLGPPLVSGNEVTPLRNGREIFPAMLEAVRSAKKTITFETFIYWRGEVGDQFAAALTERARAGVKVHVIIDWIGADKIDGKYIKDLRDAGGEVVRYHALKWYNLPGASRINNRTHRKILVVDGAVGFTGGVGIADEWDGDARTKKEYRDNHYRVVGPVVAELQAAFLDNWMKSTGEVLHGPDYFPLIPKDSPASLKAQVFKSSYDGGSDSMQLLYLLSIAAAADHIRLASAYFVPDARTTQALVDARKRGVQVDILVPGSSIDVEPVRDASRAKWGPLLKAGVNIYEYQPTMYHVKQAIFDDRWVTVGSSNLDDRSFRLNDEVNLSVLDREFAKVEIEAFERDKGRAKQVTYEMWKNRSLAEKLQEGFWSLWGPQL